MVEVLGINRIKRRAFVQIVAVGALLLFGGAARAADPVDDYIRAEMERQKIPGLSLAIVKDGKVIKAQGYGLANLELKVPATTDTVFQLGSVGKQFTAGAVMLLVEDGKVGLDDPVKKYLDFAPDSWKDITVRRLLTHTSGIKDYTRIIDLSVDATAEETAKKLLDKPLDFEPGSKWAYSNSNYLLLGILIEKASGTFYGDLLKARVFKPLGMTTAQVNNESDIIPNRAAGYEPRADGTLRNQAYVPPTFNTYADGSLIMSARDMVKWANSLYGDTVFKKTSRDLMTTPVTLTDGKTYPYGFGWGMKTINGHSVIEHSGGWQGFVANISRYVDDKLTVIVLINRAGVSPVRITHQVAELVEPALKPAAAQPIEDKTPQIAELIRKVVQQTADNKLDKNLFAPEMWDAMKEFATPQGANRIKLLGALKKVTLLAHREKEDGEHAYQYKLEFARVKLRCLLSIDKAGKIAGMLLTPEE